VGRRSILRAARGCTDAASGSAGEEAMASTGEGVSEGERPAGNASCTARQARSTLGAAARGCAEEGPAKGNLGATPIGAGTKSVASKNSISATEGDEPRSAYGKEDSSKMT